MSTATTGSIEVNSQFGKYRLLRLLGCGGMGKVYEAEDTLLRRRVALKMLSSLLADDPDALKRFMREAQAAAALDHPHVVTIHEVGRVGESWFLSMELAVGSLQDRLQNSGRLPWQEATRLTAAVCSGLVAVHAAGLIHRDIKPANILLDAAGNPKLGDFGLVRSQKPGQTALTAEGVVVGTPDYMSPEVCRGDPPNEQSDVYSLAATWFALMTGRPLYEGVVMHVLYAHSALPPPELNSLVPDAPAGCAAVLMRALAKEPSQRHPGAQAFLTDLKGLLEPSGAVTPGSASSRKDAPSFSPFTASKRAPTARLQPRIQWMIAAVLCLLGAGATGWLIWGQGPQPIPEDDGTTARSLKGKLDAVVVRNPEGAASYHRLGDRDVLPLLHGRDYLRVEARMERPAYLYLVWIDTEGKADLIFPVDTVTKRRPSREEARQEIYLPTEKGAAPLGPGPAGTETMVLLARPERLPEAVVLEELFAGLPRMTSRMPREAAWFEDGLLVSNDRERSAIGFPPERGKLLLDEREWVTDPVIALQSHLRTAKIRQWFDYNLSVCFSTRGDPRGGQ